MNCAISGQECTEPVVSKYGHFFEKRLIHKHLEEQSQCPITDQPLTAEDLIDVVRSTIVIPKVTSSIPTLLTTLQNEVDVMALECFKVKKENQELKRQLCGLAYELDAAKRVIARMIKEKGTAPVSAVKNSTVTEMQVESQILPKELIQEFSQKGQEMVQWRRGRKPDITAEKIQGWTMAGSTKLVGISCMDQSDGMVVCGLQDGQVVVVNGDKLIKSVKKRGKKSVGIAFVRLFEHFIITRSDKIIVWEIAGEKISNIAEVDGEWVDVHPCGYLFVICQGNVKILNIRDGLNEVSSMEVGVVNSGSVHPDGMLFATVAEKVTFWDLINGGTVVIDEKCKQVLFSQSGYHVATLGEKTKVWDLRKVKCVWECDEQIVFDDSGKFIVTLSDTKTE
jgi:pre-mRNA-processing factor 19